MASNLLKLANRVIRQATAPQQTRPSIMGAGLAGAAAGAGVRQPSPSILGAGLVGANAGATVSRGAPPALNLPSIPTPTPPPIQARQYTPAPAAPTAAQRQAWDDMIRYATEDFALAEANAAALRQEADTARAARNRNIARDFVTRNYDARVDAGSAGMALSPSTMGRYADRLRELEAGQRAASQQQYTSQVQRGLDAVSQARRNRDRTIDQVNAQRAYAGGDHTRLLPRIYG